MFACVAVDHTLQFLNGQMMALTVRVSGYMPSKGYSANGRHAFFLTHTLPPWRHRSTDWKWESRVQGPSVGRGRVNICYERTPHDPRICINDAADTSSCHSQLKLRNCHRKNCDQLFEHVPYEFHHRLAAAELAGNALRVTRA